MKFLTIYSDYEEENSGCEWIEEEDLESAIQRGGYLYDNWADYILLTEYQARVVAQKIVDSLLDLEEASDGGQDSRPGQISNL